MRAKKRQPHWAWNRRKRSVHRTWSVTERFACFVQFYWIRECLKWHAVFSQLKRTFGHTFSCNRYSAKRTCVRSQTATHRISVAKPPNHQSRMLDWWSCTKVFGVNPKVPAIRSLTCVLDWCMIHVSLTHACACAALWLKPIAVCFQQFTFSSNRSLLQQCHKNAKISREARKM